jgi:hypothetical protein
MSHVGGLSVQDVSDHSISLGIDICVPSSRHQHTNRELLLQLTHAGAAWLSHMAAADLQPTAGEYTF